MKQITIYDASGRDRISIHAWKVMFAELAEFKELIYRLVGRNIAGQFRQSFLGYVWVALPPVATTVVFMMLRRADIINVPMADNALPYALFALIGTTIWTTFSQTTMMCTSSIYGAGSLVSKIYFPREILVLTALGTSLVNTVIRLVVLALSFVILLYLPQWQVIFVPLVLIPVFLFAVGIGYLLAPVNTMMNDIGRVMEFAFQFGMFLAPTVYPTPAWDATSTTWQVALYWLHTLNPVSHTIYAVHDLVHVGYWIPDFGFLASFVLSLLTFAVGWRFFHICEPLLAERL